MISKEAEMLRKIINNNGYYISGFEWKIEYSFEEDCTQTNLIMTFCQAINPLGERLLKAKFYCVESLNCKRIFDCFFEPFIEIEDMSVRGFETANYYVHEIEDSFDFYCGKIEYWFQEWQDE
ncbi:MAG: hypothetical protein IKN54_10005 [Lachnospiraceae bacterium]|nr:hypothetical protein [Lachnospiraceae bacterium]